MIADLPEWALDWVRSFIVAQGEPLTGKEDLPDFELWREHIKDELADRFEDLATADAALSDATCKQRTAEADLWRVVRQNVRECAVAETAKRKANADAQHNLRDVPLKEGNAAKIQEADIRVKRFVRIIKEAGLDAKSGNAEFISALGVKASGKKFLIPSAKDTKIEISRATLYRYFEAVRQRLSSK